MEVNLRDAIEILADKIGVAVEVLQPVAEETVRQVSIRGWTSVILCVLIGLAMIVVARCLQKFVGRSLAIWNETRDRSDGCWEWPQHGAPMFASIALYIIGSWSICFGLLSKLPQALAPLPTVVSRVLSTIASM